jgi:hypothetical protein
MNVQFGSDKVKAIEFNIKGIKCDNPDCDFRDETVKFEDYPLWLNRPCPKCGWNLLTQADLDATKALIKLVNIINWITKPFMFILKKTKRIKVFAEMNGTGKVKFKQID